LSTTTIRKPDPRFFALAATRCGRSLADAWMVGDGESDILGAHRASIRTMWLRRGRTWPRTDLKPDRTADSLVEALSRLSLWPPSNSALPLYLRQMQRRPTGRTSEDARPAAEGTS
jgi:phosphoglycolate phosphatase-like HAD superfamily hydrolase